MKKTQRKIISALFAAAAVLLFQTTPAYANEDLTAGDAQEMTVACEAAQSYEFEVDNRAVIPYGYQDYRAGVFSLRELLLANDETLQIEVTRGTLLHSDGIHSLPYTLDLQCPDKIYPDTALEEYPVGIRVNWLNAAAGSYSGSLEFRVVSSVNNIVWSKNMRIETTIPVPNYYNLTLSVIIQNSDLGHVTYNGQAVGNGSQYLLSRGEYAVFHIAPEDGCHLAALLLNGKDIKSQVAGNGNVLFGPLYTDSVLEIKFAPGQDYSTPKTGDSAHVGLWSFLMLLSAALLILILKQKKKNKSNNADIEKGENK